MDVQLSVSRKGVTRLPKRLLDYLQIEKTGGKLQVTFSNPQEKELSIKPAVFDWKSVQGIFKKQAVKIAPMTNEELEEAIENAIADSLREEYE